MSLVLLRRCPKQGCRYNRKAVYADRAQMRNHILYDHDYQEKLEAALSLGIIANLSEHRGPVWLAESLTDFSLEGANTQ